MDVSKFLESDYVTADLVKNSQSKVLVIVSAGAEESYKDKAGVSFLVEIDGKTKKWKANKTSLKNLVDKYGSESQKFVGKTVALSVVLAANGKESVVGSPA